MNSEVFKFEHDIIQLINNCELPVSVVYLVLKSLYKDVESVYEKTVSQENLTKVMEDAAPICTENEEKEQESESSPE